MWIGKGGDEPKHALGRETGVTEWRYGGENTGYQKRNKPWDQREANKDAELECLDLEDEHSHLFKFVPGAPAGIDLSNATELCP